MNQAAVTTIEKNFVKPHFITELGEEGLTSIEVSKSLGMRKDNLHTLVDKLVSSGFMELPRTQEVKNHLGQTVSAYLFPTEEAKLLVTQSATKEGIEYCRWLIQCEKKVEQVQSLSPMLQYLIQLEIKQKEQDTRIKVVEEELSKVTKSIGSAGFYTVMAYASHVKKERITLSQAGKIGRAATKKCKELGIQVCSIPDPRFGVVNTYPVELLEELWGEGK